MSRTLLALGFLAAIAAPAAALEQSPRITYPTQSGPAVESTFQGYGAVDTTTTSSVDVNRGRNAGPALDSGNSARDNNQSSVFDN